MPKRSHHSMLCCAPALLLCIYSSLSQAWSVRRQLRGITTAWQAGMLLRLTAHVVQAVQASTIALCWRASMVGNAVQASMRRQAEAQTSAPDNLLSAQQSLVRLWRQVGRASHCCHADPPACTHLLQHAWWKPALAHSCCHTCLPPGFSSQCIMPEPCRPCTPG